VNRVEVAVEGVHEPVWLPRLATFAEKAIARLGRDGWDLSLLLCDDATIRGLNAQYRDKDESTDVLSFELGETVMDMEFGERWAAGDIAISLDTLAVNASYFGVSQDEELRRLVVHGILHLDGMDHEDNDPSRPMLRLQEELLADLGEEHILL
jgi:probable rRNA maturation factor